MPPDLTRSTFDTSPPERLLFQESRTSLFLPVICFWRNLSKFLMPHSMPGSCLIASLFFLENLPVPPNSRVFQPILINLLLMFGLHPVSQTPS